MEVPQNLSDADAMGDYKGKNLLSYRNWVMENYISQYLSDFFNQDYPLSVEEPMSIYAPIRYQAGNGFIRNKIRKSSNSVVLRQKLVFVSGSHMAIFDLMDI